AGDGAAGDRQCGSLGVDGPAVAGGGVARERVVHEDDVVGADGADGAAALCGAAGVGVGAAGQRQAGDGDGVAGAAEVEEAVGAVAADGDDAGAWAVDLQALFDVDDPGRQGDGAGEAGGEGHGVAGRGRADDLAQRAGAAVIEQVGD